MNNCWEDISPCLVRKPDTCIPTIQTRVTHAKCPTLDLDSMGLAPCRTSLQPILQGNKVLWQNFGHNLALKGCETNNTDKVSLVTDASEQSEGSQEKQTAPLQHQGTTTRVFFHRDRWTPQKPPMLPSLHGFFWERITYQILKFFLSFSLASFFTSRPQKSCCRYQPWCFQSNKENLFCWGSSFS